MKNLFTLLFLGYLTINYHLVNAQYTVQNPFPSLSFPAPIEFVSPDDSTNRLFVASQSGIIRVFPNNSSAATSTVFLNIASKILYSGEQGLLGLAFHPDYKQNGYFYVNYVRSSSTLQTVIARYKVSAANPNLADPNSEVILLTFDQPFSNHKGGKLVFGNDGYLYIATGDGGSGGDPFKNGQNHNTLLGKILRIDVNTPSNGLNYAIPPDNPFVDSTGFRKEIFTYGMRNPWKISVDKPTGTIWAGDVGQGAREEIDIIEKGGNYGWNTMEGFACYSPSQNCNTKGLALPVWDYGRGDGNSITGGVVYRGREMPDLQGKYVYGDFGSGKVWALTYKPGQTPVNTLLFNAGGNITAFGEDADHELYICLYSGTIRKIMDPQMPFVRSFSPEDGLPGSTIILSGKNFQATTTGNVVKFGEVQATVTAATATSLSVTVPSGMVAGPVPITVTANGRTATPASNFTINKFDQTITFAPLPDKIFGDTTVTLEASASSGLPVILTIVSGPATLDSITNRLIFTGTGLVTVKASQAGNGYYHPAPEVVRVFSLNKAEQIIHFASLPDKTYGDSAFVLTATSNAGLAVTFAVADGPAFLRVVEGLGSRLSLVGAGPVRIIAFQSGNANFFPAPNVERIFMVNKASQQINWEPITDKLANDPPFALNPVTSSDLAVALETISGPAALNLVNNQYLLTLTGAGTVAIRASQPGNENFLAAPPMEQTFTVNAVTGTEPTMAEQILVFPNPARELVTVRFAGVSPAKNGMLNLYNTIGQAVLTREFNNVGSSFQATFSVSSLPKGIYQLNVKLGERIFRKKMVVN